MKNIKEYREKALMQYEDLRDTIAVIEAMHLQGTRPGMQWQNFKKKVNSRNN